LIYTSQFLLFLNIDLFRTSYANTHVTYKYIHARCSCMLLWNISWSTVVPKVEQTHAISKQYRCAPANLTPFEHSLFQITEINHSDNIGTKSEVILISRCEAQINHKGLCPSSCLTSSAEAALPSIPSELTRAHCYGRCSPAWDISRNKDDSRIATW